MNPTAEKTRVLVADDNRDAATTLGLLLETAGFQVETCFDGQAALNAVDRLRPEPCVLDINMPAMNGYELAGWIRARFPEAPPVLATVTAYEDYGHLTEAVGAGFDLHFTKPADPADVAGQVEDCVRRRKADRRLYPATAGLADALLAEIDKRGDADTPVRLGFGLSPPGSGRG
jgi:CheY-like chemotaxis protein